MKAATYTKLKDGSWGLRIAASWCKSTWVDLNGREPVTVTKRDGTTKIEIIGRVLWSGRTGKCVTLATIHREQGRSWTAPRAARHNWSDYDHVANRRQRAIDEAGDREDRELGIGL